jgi:hypothetical protein
MLVLSSLAFSHLILSNPTSTSFYEASLHRHIEEIFTMYAHGLMLLLFYVTALSQDLGFVDFASNLTVTPGDTITLTWQNQQDYVNITLARFYFYGGGSEYHSLITCR